MTGRAMIPERIGPALSIVLFGCPAILLWFATQLLVPALLARGTEPLAAWFLAGSLVFLPLLAAALLGATIALPEPSFQRVLEHLRVRRMSARDWRLAGLALTVTIAAMAALHIFNKIIWPQLPAHPPFLTVQPLKPEQYYLIALWLPFFALNILGEEFWWRGFIQPRQEPVFGSSTWIVQGVLHGAFHFSFGLGVLFVLWPAVFSIPWAVQRSRNTSVGIVVHGVINGPAFLAVTLGLLPTQIATAPNVFDGTDRDQVLHGADVTECANPNIISPLTTSYRVAFSQN
jgi:membrane protease YdiL (CAAX protease family)